MKNTLDIYKASAGSGKTYLLTQQYLQLLFEQPNNYRTILAVTFTNKATAEMKGRILLELEKLANNPQMQSGENAMADHLLENSSFENLEALSKQARKIYGSILHDYSRFAVTTIDSFVQRVIRSFAFEIGMDAGFTLQLETETVKEDLTALLFARLDHDPDILHWVTDMAMTKLPEGKSWDFNQETMALADELFKERFQEYDFATRDNPHKHDLFNEVRKQVKTTIDQFEERWKTMAQKGLTFMDANSLEQSYFTQGSRGIAGVFSRMLNNKYVSPLDNSYTANILLNNGPLYTKKTEQSIQALIDGHAAAIIHQIEEIIAFFNDASPDYFSAKAIQQNLNTLRLVDIFNQELKNYRTEKNILLSSDTNLLLRELTRDTDASFIYEKIGNYYQHYLIDEFQDTSAFQWDNFKPLIENTLAEGRFNLLVGDVKQAVYRWRNGDWRLLHQKAGEQLAAFKPQIYKLEENYRSAKPIIEFLNYLFDIAPRLLQQQFNQEMTAAPAAVQERMVAQGYHAVIENAYADSFQNTPPKAANNGQACIHFLEPDDEKDEMEMVIEPLYETIQQLLQQGYQPGDIGILTRRNKDSAYIIEQLTLAQKETGGIPFNLVSSDSLLLYKNEAVALLISALGWLRLSSNLNLVQLRQHYMQYHQLQYGHAEMFATNGDEKVLPANWFAMADQLRSYSLPEMVNAIIILLNLPNKPLHAAYLLAFQDLVSEWSQQGEDGLQAFLTRWEQEKERKSLASSEGGHAVEVITIHKSKGLAFGIVLIPYLTWQFKPNMNPLLWVQTAETPFNQINVLPVTYKAELANSAFAFEYYEELLMNYMDSLNLFYVAATRTRYRLIAWGLLPKKESNGITEIKTISDLCLNMVKNKETPRNASIPAVYENFDGSNWVYGADESKPTNKQAADQLQMPPLAYHNWQQSLQIRFSPLLNGRETAGQLPRSQGLLLHDTLAQLKHPNQLKEQLRTMIANGLFTQNQGTVLEKILTPLLKHPLLHGWTNGLFNRLSERELLTPGRLLRRPDLVLYNENETLVIDFKFTEGEQDEPKHIAQVNEYVQLLRQLNFENVSGHLLYGLSGKHLSTGV